MINKNFDDCKIYIWSFPKSKTFEIAKMFKSSLEKSTKNKNYNAHYKNKEFISYFPKNKAKLLKEIFKSI